MFLKALTILLIPILLIQGRKVKKNTLRLPEPEGLREGITGRGKPLSILIVGDSAAAGVGVLQQNDALLGCLLKELSTEFKIEWKLHAKTGNTTSQVMYSLDDLNDNHYDVVVTSIGVNDVTKFMSADIWMNKQVKLYEKIKEKFSPNLMIATGVPPMQKFPALPNPLAWLFGLYAQQMNHQLEGFVLKQQNMEWIKYDLEKYRSLNLTMAEDGFHPSKEVYKIWAQEIAYKIHNGINKSPELNHHYGV
ncbi:SGNH/GDSL hydrolase family protein [Acinetobacter equi]|uniref:Lipase n=1 Tax=Acinetobacter equi TaxID=1324350 RepID=A0A0N9VS18_9GAMM|nr:SGNH/GDSL hydrolase family protein [Acinetobacter equi]ALH96156.1 lipase [Acinetobacter equi]